ncbi:hypothetical protein LOC67_22695 [Stieleria sp. JC731]|uniref:hypothetical protein n=1 Tax=Stieleria sp. JC731 TaxID=2894195 RepID=UPI001E5B2796|nr:hypothetical protein [Stieleria sp. JC731]MCC9603368.1 hypothetical protein [Stieleria sp. JC731]
MSAVPLQRRFPIRFSLRTLFVFATLAAAAVAGYRYLNPPPTIEERLDNSFTGHAIYAYPEVGRFGFHSDVLRAIAESTSESLKRPEIVAAWTRSSDNELVVLFLASSFAVDSLSTRDLNGTVTTIRLPADELQCNRLRREHSIDFQVVAPLQTVNLATIESVALVNDDKLTTEFFPVRHSPTQQRAEP